MGYSELRFVRTRAGMSERVFWGSLVAKDMARMPDRDPRAIASPSPDREKRSPEDVTEEDIQAMARHILRQKGIEPDNPHFPDALQELLGASVRALRNYHPGKGASATTWIYYQMLGAATHIQRTLYHQGIHEIPLDGPDDDDNRTERDPRMQDGAADVLAAVEEKEIALLVLREASQYPDLWERPLEEWVDSPTLRRQILSLVREICSRSMPHS